MQISQIPEQTIGTQKTAMGAVQQVRPPSAVVRQDSHCLAGIDGDAVGVDVSWIHGVFVFMSCADMVIVWSREAFVFCQ